MRSLMLLASSATSRTGNVHRLAVSLVGKMAVARSSSSPMDTSLCMMLLTQQRHFASESTSKSSKSSKYSASSSAAAAGPPSLPYAEQKRAAKERRRELYQQQQERQARLPTRRTPANGEKQPPRDEKRRAFRSWFIAKKVGDEYLDRKARQAGMEWNMNVAVLLQRIPVVLPDQSDWDRKYENLKAHLLQYGKIYPKSLFPNQPAPEPYNPDANPEEELMQMLLSKGIVPSPRETEADKTGNVRTTNRKLKTNVYLAVKDASPVVLPSTGGAASASLWQLPTVQMKPEETFLQATKRAIPEKVGAQVEFWCPSNCPCGVDLRAYPVEQQQKEGVYGVKTFFMKIQYDEGDVSETEMSVQDFAWLDRTEMTERIKEQQGEEQSKLYWYLL